MWKWKGRIVYGGDAIRNIFGDEVLFEDVGTVPSTMTATRCLAAAKALYPDMELLMADCLRAYTQAKMTGVTSYVRLPRAWWPAHWHGKYKDPVVPLERALYGHPAAGDMWHSKISSVLKAIGFQEVESWPSVYIKRGETPSKNQAITLYVDDLVMLGGTGLRGTIAKIREHIETEDPVPLD